MPESRHKPRSGADKAWLARIDGQLATLRERLVALAAINSGTDNVAGVNRVVECMAEHYAMLGCDAQRQALRPATIVGDDGEVRERPLGDAFSFVQRPAAPLQVLL